VPHRSPEHQEPDRAQLPLSLSLSPSASLPHCLRSHTLVTQGRSALLEDNSSSLPQCLALTASALALQPRISPLKPALFQTQAEA
jgi:hypothetical protein